MKKFNRNIALFLVVILAIAGCKTKRVTQKSPLVNVSSGFILDQVVQAEFEFRTINAKLSVDVDAPNQNNSFKINMRSNSDSLIWMSITPALGIEAARLLIQPDTLKYIDKLKKEYFVGDYSLLDSVFRYETKFLFMENLLIGNPVELLPEEKYTATVEGLNYVVQTKVKRKIKKAFDISKKDMVEDTLYTDLDVVKEKKFEKAVDKLSEEDLIIKRYYVRASDFRISRTIIDDVLYKRTIVITYDDFEDVDGVPFPKKISITATTPEETAKFDLEYSRIRTNEDQAYPFKIPSKYQPLQ